MNLSYCFNNSPIPISRKHVVDLVSILNLKMSSMLDLRMDSLMRDLQLFIFRDHLLRLQWEELIARYGLS